MKNLVVKKDPFPKVKSAEKTAHFATKPPRLKQMKNRGAQPTMWVIDLNVNHVSIHMKVKLTEKCL